MRAPRTPRLEYVERMLVKGVADWAFPNFDLLLWPLRKIAGSGEDKAERDARSGSRKSSPTLRARLRSRYHDRG